MSENRKTEPEVGQRLRQLRTLLAPEHLRDNQTAFAAWVGIPYTTWNNYENGFPMDHKVAERVIAKLPGVTTDWLYSGRTRTLSVEALDRLSEATPSTEAKRTD
jgi:hypothetical protein